MEVRGVKTWFDKGTVVELDDDVQNIVQQIKAISDRLHVFWNHQSQQFDIVESCLDNTDRLVFSVPELDGRVVGRLIGADHWGGSDVPSIILPDHLDFASVIDRENAALEATKNEAAADRVHDAGERLHWALDLGPGQNSAGGKISMTGTRKRNQYDRQD